MKFYKKIFLIALLVLVDSSFGDIKSDLDYLETLVDKDHPIESCSISPELNSADENTRKSSLIGMVAHCAFNYDNTNFLQQTVESETFEELTTLWDNYCEKIGSIKRCHDLTTSLAEVCLSEEDFRIFEVVRNYFQMLLGETCYGGDDLTTNIDPTWDAIVAKSYTGRDAEKECDIEARTRLGVPNLFDGPDASVVSTQICQYMDYFSDCLEVFSKTYNVEFNSAVEYYTSLMDKMECA